MAPAYSLVKTKPLQQLAQIVKPDTRIRNPTEKPSKRFLSFHNVILHADELEAGEVGPPGLPATACRITPYQVKQVRAAILKAKLEFLS